MLSASRLQKLSAITLFLSTLLVSRVVCQDLVDTVGLKVCNTGSGVSCMSSDFSELQGYVSELTPDNMSAISTSLSYDAGFMLTTSNHRMSTMDLCDGQGDQYLNDVVKTINNDLATASSYVKKIYSSCAEIYDKENDPVDGYYKIQKSDGTVIQVYCLMSSGKCSGGGGWMRVGYFNTASSDKNVNQCPSPWVFKTYDELTYPLCQRESSQPGCNSVYYESFGMSYSKVCGKAKGYQYGSPDSFTSINIDSNYLDGVSLTYGSSPRTHIWSFVGGVNTDGTAHYDCPCNSFNNDNPPPAVGNDYYCEAGLPQGQSWNPASLQTHDPLWDGEQCESLEGGCCKSTSLPYFTKTLGKTISDDIEVRICDDENENNERIPLEIFELYVQ